MNWVCSVPLGAASPGAEKLGTSTVPSVGCLIGWVEPITRNLEASPQSQSSPGVFQTRFTTCWVTVPKWRLSAVPGGRVSVPYAPVFHSSCREVHHSSFPPHAGRLVGHENA